MKTPPTDDDDEDFEPTYDFGRRTIAPKSVDSSYFQQTVVVLLSKSWYPLSRDLEAALLCVALP